VDEKSAASTAIKAAVESQRWIFCRAANAAPIGGPTPPLQR
jgi:hypothetical protein